MFARVKTFYLRGYVYFSMLSSIALYAIAMNAFFEPISRIGVSMDLLFIGIVFFVLIVPGVIGLVDYKVLSHYEQALAWNKTEGAKDLNKKVDAIYAYIEAEKCLQIQNKK